MRTILSEHFGSLALPVGEFLALEHGTEFVGYRRITVGFGAVVWPLDPDLAFSASSPPQTPKPQPPPPKSTFVP